MYVYNYSLFIFLEVWNKYRREMKMKLKKLMIQVCNSSSIVLKNKGKLWPRGKVCSSRSVVPVSNPPMNPPMNNDMSTGTVGPIVLAPMNRFVAGELDVNHLMSSCWGDSIEVKVTSRSQSRLLL